MRCALVLSVLCVAALQVQAAKVPFVKARDNAVSVSLKEADVSFIHKGEAIDEKIRANPDNFVVTYEISSANGGATLIDDYNSYIRVIRMANGDKCIAAPITPQRTFQTGEEFAAWKTNTNRTMIEESAEIWIEKNASPIKSRGVFSQEVLDLCEGLPIYWGHMKTQDLARGGLSRPKRADVYIVRIGDRYYLVVV